MLNVLLNALPASDSVFPAEHTHTPHTLFLLLFPEFDLMYV